MNPNFFSLKNLITVFASVSISISIGQNDERNISNFLMEQSENLSLSRSDVNEILISSHHQSGKLHFYYILQEINEIPIYNSRTTLVSIDEKFKITGNRLLSISEKEIIDDINFSAPKAIIEAYKAITNSEIDFLESELIFDPISKTFSNSEISETPIRIEEIYYSVEDRIVRAWSFDFQPIGSNHWWSVQIDAGTAEILQQADWVSHCEFDGPNCREENELLSSKETRLAAPAPPPSTDTYNVFPYPVESPSHGPRSLVVGPSDPIASPHGWHDVDGVDGDEYTITRGNNVFAYEDTDDNNQPGYSPDGGAAIVFDFPLDINQPGNNYLDPAITNLFYWNNIMHDVWYQYGFDEASGNFQKNNYGNGGQANDAVRAEAQDGSGMNNANFATPTDGDEPRMQMYLWDAPGAPNVFSINSPAVIQGTYTVTPADFGPGVPVNSITTDVVIYEDGVSESYDACEPAINGAQQAGQIVIIRRSASCNFINQVERAQNEGAAAVIIVDNIPEAPFPMTGSGVNITIPAVMINQYNGENIISQIEGGTPVNCTLGDNGPYDLDSDLDNGVIAHEYGHGISTRLTGGANNSSCLWNDEQMGEGWSDWFGLMLTIEPGDERTDVRGIGTFVSGQSTTGTGIRPAPYSTDWSVNGFTYAATNNESAISLPHGIGFVWATMLWEMTWDLIDEYGFDPDIYYGTGGNNIAMHLVINGIKLQACSPGFIDGRDAILEADQLLYGGIHECLIWKAFARRGLGYSASQGSANSRLDQTQAFDLPPGVNQTFNIEACDQYTWDVDNQTYNTSGTYTFNLGPSGIACDTVATLNLTITSLSSLDITTALESTSITSNATGVDYQWLDCNGDFLEFPDEDGPVFNASVNGDYAVQISVGGCVDTSECVTVNSVSVIENSFDHNIQVYPNPTDGKLIVSFSKEIQDLTLEITDVRGRTLLKESKSDGQEFIINIHGETGFYFLRIATAEGKNATFRIEKF